MTKSIITISVAIFLSLGLQAQNDRSDEKTNKLPADYVHEKSANLVCDGPGLDGVIVEKYYVSDENDASDTDGGSLPVGSITYRIFLDMEADYVLETVFGSPQHSFTMSTSTSFFNNEDRGETNGANIGDQHLGSNTVPLDSYISFGAASDEHIAIPKSIDSDGSIIGGANNDGGSTSSASGLLINEDPIAGLPLTQADGLIVGSPSGLQVIGDLPAQLNSYLGEANAPGTIVCENGAFAVLGGLEGATDENLILIAQVTTDGIFSFDLNFRLGAPDGGYEQYVHSNPGIISGSENQMELTCDDLSYTHDPQSPDAVDDFVQAAQVEIYPNPNRGEEIYFSINDWLGQSEPMKIVVFDIAGRQLMNTSLASTSTNTPKSIQFDTPLKEGIYLIEFDFEDFRIAKQFIVH